MDDYICFDIECDSLNVETAKIVCIGVYSSWDDKIQNIWMRDIHIFRQLMFRAKFAVGFNSDGFDLPIIMNKTNHIFHSEDAYKYKTIDLYKVVKLRQSMFSKIKFNESDENSKGGFSLDNICYKFGLSRKEKGFEYKLLQKPIHEMTNEEIAIIDKYTKQDIKITNELYLYLNEAFSGFRHYLPQKDIDRKSDMRSSLGSLAYKILCHRVGIKETYNDVDAPSEYKGGFVLTPSKESAVGNVHVLDLSSAYPHCYMSCNLFTHCTSCRDNCDKKYAGGTAFGTKLKLHGTYCTRYGMGGKESAIKEMYLERVEAKKIAKYDKSYEHRQSALKAVLVSLYGISGSPVFKQVYDIDTAQDCTMIARYFIKMLHKYLREQGYEVLYGDTDSCYTLDPFDDLDKLMRHTDEYVKELNTILPFPQSTFDVENEDDIQYIQFFSDDKGRLVKKRYVYLTDEDKVVVKGLAVIRGDSSMISRDIWKNRLIPHIIENKSCKISINKMKTWVDSALAENISQAAVEFKVRDYDSYKHKSQIQAQISKVLGEGTHMLVKTFRNYGIGLSKGSRYCTIEQAISDGIGAFNMKRINSDLSPFVMDGLIKLDGFEVCEEKKDMFDF